MVVCTQLFKNFSSLIIWVAKNKFFLLAINSVRIIFIVLLESSKIHVNFLMCTVEWCRKSLQCPSVFSERSEPMITQQMVYEGMNMLTNCIFYTLSVLVSRNNQRSFGYCARWWCHNCTQWCVRWTAVNQQACCNYWSRYTVILLNYF